MLRLPQRATTAAVVVVAVGAALPALPQPWPAALPPLLPRAAAVAAAAG